MDLKVILFSFVTRKYQTVYKKMSVNLTYFKLITFNLTKFVEKVYEIGLQRYWE